MPTRPLTKADVPRLVSIDAERFPEIDPDFDVPTGRQAWWTVRESDFDDIFSPNHPSSFHGIVYYSGSSYEPKVEGAVLLETQKKTIDVISTIRVAAGERDIIRTLFKEAKIFAKKHGKKLRFIVPDGDDSLLQFIRAQRWTAILLPNHFEFEGKLHDGWELCEPVLTVS